MVPPLEKAFRQTLMKLSLVSPYGAAIVSSIFTQQE